MHVNPDLMHHTDFHLPFELNFQNYLLCHIRHFKILVISKIIMILFNFISSQELDAQPRKTIKCFKNQDTGINDK